MRIEIPFNEEVSRKQLQMLHDLAWKNKKYYWKNSIYWGLFITLLGIATVHGKSNLGYLFILLGIIQLTGFFVNHYKSETLHRKLFEEFETGKKTYIENPLSIWEFSENEFKFSLGKNSVSIDWADFKTYKIIDNVIFMFTKTNQPYILEKEEVGDENFEKIIEVISNKIQLST
jgi:hypothetical protein